MDQSPSVCYGGRHLEKGAQAAEKAFTHRLRLVKAPVMSTLLYGCEYWKLTTHVGRKQNNTASKMLSKHYLVIFPI